jgi:transcription elongation factor Elf1
MTRTSPNTVNHTCTFCGHEYKKSASEMVEKGQNFNVVFCGQCKNMETIRKGNAYAVVYQHIGEE